MEKHTTPQSLEVEHKELHEQLKKAIDSGSKTGDVAKAVAKLLHPHFEKEEEYAMPLLGLLSSLSRETKEGEVGVTTTKDTQQKILTMTDKLKEDLPNMLEEHKEIVGALENLIYAAKQENKSVHPAHNPRFNHDMQLEIDCIEWALQKIELNKIPEDRLERVIRAMKDIE